MTDETKTTGLHALLTAIYREPDPLERLGLAIVAHEEACSSADGAELDYRVEKAHAMLAATGKNAEQREAEVVVKTEALASHASAARRRADAIGHVVVFLRGQVVAIPAEPRERQHVRFHLGRLLDGGWLTSVETESGILAIGPGYSSEDIAREYMAPILSALGDAGVRWSVATA